MLIQACQVFSTFSLLQLPEGGNTESDAPTPSAILDPHYNKHIVLRRPHTALLLATVTGGLAIRGEFSGAMAQQFRSADGIKDIAAMFITAANEVCMEQTPEFRMTLNKSLILPPCLKAPQNSER